MEPVIEHALREVINDEKNAFDFYRSAAGMVKDERTWQVFELLASEATGHINSFHTIYAGSVYEDDLKSLLRLPPDHNYPPYRALLAKVGGNPCERQTLEISLQGMLERIGRYTSLATGFRNPGLCAIFKQALFNTYRYYHIIHAEYIRVIESVKQPDKVNQGQEGPDNGLHAPVRLRKRRGVARDQQPWLPAQELKNLAGQFRPAA
jgi:rubrerythrin